MNIKNIVAALLIGVTLVASMQASRKEAFTERVDDTTAYGCTIGGMDGDYSEVFNTKEECKNYCVSHIGAPAVCQKVGKKSNVNLEDVD